MTENQPARPPAGTTAASGTGNAVARRGDLVVICLRHRDWKDGQPREYDDFWLGQVTSVTRAGLVRLYRPAGTFFITTDVRPLGYADGMEFCRELPHRAGVVAIPSSVFYDNAEAGRSQVRFAFCKKQEVLAEALARLAGHDRN